MFSLISFQTLGVFVRVAWTADIYSQTSLIRTLKRQNQLSALQRCPNYGAVCKERLDCIFTRLVFGESETGLHNFGEFSQSPSSVNWFCGYFMAFFMDMYFSVAEKYKKNYFLLALIKGEILTNGKVFKSHTRNQFLFHRQKKMPSKY